MAAAQPPTTAAGAIFRGARYLTARSFAMSGAAARMRRWRMRQASGRIILRIECDETQLFETLAAARLIDRLSDPSHADIERAVERLIDALARESDG